MLYLTFLSLIQSEFGSVRSFCCLFWLFRKSLSYEFEVPLFLKCLHVFNILHFSCFPNVVMDSLRNLLSFKNTGNIFLDIKRQYIVTVKHIF